MEILRGRGHVWGGGGRVGTPYASREGRGGGWRRWRGVRGWRKEGGGLGVGNRYRMLTSRGCYRRSRTLSSAWEAFGGRAAAELATEEGFVVCGLNRGFGRQGRG